VCAGLETVSSMLELFLLSPDFKNNFTPADISKFNSHTTSKYLHSFGQNFVGKKSYKNYIKKEAHVLSKCKNTGFFDGCEFFLDSGGYQASIGLIGKDQIECFTDLYYEYVEKHSNLFDRAFILDLPPGPNCKLFSNYDEVYKMNLDSYNRAVALPDEIRNKIIYVHHFRTPEMWRVYNDILDTDDMFDKFKYHSTGGLAANTIGDMLIPCIIYSLPLVSLIKRTLKYKRDILYFHILGAATYRDILFYELFKEVCKRYHGITLEITYDSSTFFKALMVGRKVPVLDGDLIRTADMRSVKLDKRFLSDGKNTENFIFENIHNICEKYGISTPVVSNIYNPVTNSLYFETRIYLMLYFFGLFSDIEQRCRDISKILIDFYDDGQFEQFNSILSNMTQMMNGGRITKKQTAKSQNVIRSLDMIKDLDEDFSEYIVNKFLIKDEFIELTGGKSLLEF
jgi:hypothetical protein